MTPENVARLARLGVVASMQPVHSDPAFQDNWRAMLGDERVRRGHSTFCPRPVTPAQPARIRCAPGGSPRARHPRLGVPCRWEEVTGRLRAGLAADFVVLDSDPFALGPDALLGARVRRTVAGGVDHQVRPSTPSADLQ